jgi:hypothetical protein
MKKSILLIAGFLVFTSTDIYADSTITYEFTNKTDTKVVFGPFVSMGSTVQATSEILRGSSGKVIMAPESSAWGNFQYGFGTEEYQKQTEYCYIEYSWKLDDVDYLPKITVYSPSGTFACFLTDSSSNGKQHKNLILVHELKGREFSGMGVGTFASIQWLTAAINISSPYIHADEVSALGRLKWR